MKLRCKLKKKKIKTYNIIKWNNINKNKTKLRKKTLRLF